MVLKLPVAVVVGLTKGLKRPGPKLVPVASVRHRVMDDARLFDDVGDEAALTQWMLGKVGDAKRLPPGQ